MHMRGCQRTAQHSCDYAETHATTALRGTAAATSYDPHLLAELCLAEQAAVSQSLVQVATAARLKHQAHVGCVIERPAQLHHTGHPAAWQGGQQGQRQADLVPL